MGGSDHVLGHHKASLKHTEELHKKRGSTAQRLIPKLPPVQCPSWMFLKAHDLQSWSVRCCGKQGS